MATSGPDVFFRHWADRGEVLFLDARWCTSTFANIAGQAAGVAGFVLQVDINARLEQIAEIAPIESEKPLDDYGAARGYALRPRYACVAGEVIVGDVDGLAAGQGGALVLEQAIVQRCWLVEISLGAFLEREMAQIAVVAVQRYYRRFQNRG